jgi:ABC-type cobalamin/Fe3+-siderophores transport system ATPase subunit
MQELTNTLYVGPFRNAIGSAQSSYYDIQTGSAFIQTFNTYKAGDNADQNEAVFQLLQEIRRIFGFDALDLNAGANGQSLQMTLDGRSYRLSEQGAGLSHFIVVLVNVLVRRPTFLLIDEPELNLHSALQLDFLSTLAGYTTRGVMFATHSLGLARTGADHIYALIRPNGGWSQVSKYEESRDLVTLLGQLSFERRPDLGFDRVLMVEGKSDLRAVSRLLRLYDKEHEVLLLPLHGGEFIRGDVEQELIDMKRLGGNPKYLIDSEREYEGAALGANRQAFVDLCTGLDITGHVLARRALENYFTEDTVKRVFRGSLHALGPYEKRGWPKRENWRIADVMRRDDIDGTDLGEFLSTV